MTLLVISLLKLVIEIAHRRGVPVIVDAAAEIPPVANLHHFCEIGADLVIFSGGKDIGGPQSPQFLQVSNAERPNNSGKVGATLD